jgi:hypothetical protein
MNTYPMHNLCGAHCRTTGEPCKNHQMPNGRCRMHGGKSTGRPVTSGLFSKKVLEDRQRTVAFNREIRELLRII